MLLQLLKSIHNRPVLLQMIMWLAENRFFAKEKKRSGNTVSIVHYIPGRLRIRAEMLRKQTLVALSIKETLSIVEGISKVTVNPATGSILLFYDENLLHPEQLKAAVQRLVEDEDEDNGTATDQSSSSSYLESLFSSFSNIPWWQLITIGAVLTILTSMRDNRKSNER